ncbi:MurR/RpiR family transcriptional regulator [Aquamicrobium zhengzhouense]|uniref:MurR/RpiR family transcriptional regulator n=1 Tax=Aquamicrobium zhengzhouense TaxID=2781738 RepID=A0ABS0SHD3_9HYPH|nr:MurR/RpiR family transcriptional regulator [Aquamicrobium zhengzhouense]MBI1622708.1 MurR/RpiR family transcriptional regulator [Aquamicrobium zhengzhouense]
MEPKIIRERLTACYDALPRQMQQAARYVLDHPADVPLLSMRRQAREAGVQPATMTRLAKRVGFDGYEAIRDIYATALRDPVPQTFTAKGGAQVRRQLVEGDRALAQDMIHRLSHQMAELATEAGLASLEGAAQTLSSAKRIYCVGMRSSYGIAWQFHYMLSMVGDRSVLLDGPGGTAIDALGRIAPGDALLAVSVAPYTKVTVELAQWAAARGATLVAVTDSAVSPLARTAQNVIVVPIDSASFLHTMAPAFVVAEILGSLIAGHLGDEALSALKRFDADAESLAIHLQSSRTRKTAKS